MAKQQCTPLELEDRARAAVEYGADFASRTLFLCGSVDEVMAGKLLASLAILDSTPGSITVRIMSGGGEVSSGFAIYDALRRSKNEVVTEGFGEVQSMAAVILQAGARRMLSPTCRLMVHDPTLTLDATLGVNLLKVRVREAKLDVHAYQLALAQRSGLPRAEVARLCAAETYLTAREAVRVNFADGVLSPRRRR